MTKEADHNNGKHLDRIITHQECEKHHSPLGNPCWWIQSAHGFLRAICNDRALKYGARGEVTPYQKPIAPNSKKKEHIR